MTFPICEQCSHRWHGLTCVTSITYRTSGDVYVTETCKCPSQFKEPIKDSFIEPSVSHEGDPIKHPWEDK